MLNLKRLAIIPLAIALATGCDSPEEAPATETSAQEAPAAAPAAAMEEAAVEEKVAAPRIAEAKAEADDKIGVLPEGIGLAIGASIPDVEVQNAKGETVQLSALAAEEPILLIFYRGGWCPFCNFQIRELTQAYAQFEERGVKPVAISVDSVDEVSKTEGAYTIPFPVLSDPDLLAHRGFNVINEVPAGDRERLKKMGMDLEASSKRDHGTVAIPGVFLIDATGVVRWSHANEDYRVRPSIEQLLAAIDAAAIGR